MPQTARDGEQSTTLSVTNSASRKRKQSPSSPPPHSASPPAIFQTSITDHFSAKQLGSGIPESKRSKPNSGANTPPTAAGDKLKPLNGTAMLNSPAARQQPPVIDLTSSPPSDPTATKVSKPPPFQTHAGPRKLVVKNLKKSTKKDADSYFDTTWALLDKALSSVFKRERIPMSMEELYRGVENLCRADKAAAVYDKLRTRCDKYVGEQLKPQINAGVGGSSVTAVRVIENAWQQWGAQLSTIRSIFLYLDRSYLFSLPKLQSIEAMGVDLFKKHVVSDPTLEPKFLGGMFELFQQDRQNQAAEPVAVPILLSCVRMVTELGLYTSGFEPRFIDVSRKYFAELADQESQTGNLAGYLRQCATQLSSEASLCDRYQLDPSTKRELIAVVEDEMVRKQVPLLKDKERVRELLERRDYESLEILYSVLSRVDRAGELLKPAWEAWIGSEGTKIVVDKEKEAEMVPRLLDFKSTLDSIWTGPFRKNDIIGYALRESFAAFINERRRDQASANNSKPAEMIAKYVDLLLRSGTKGLPPVEGHGDVAGDDDAQLAYRLELVLDLFRFIQGKDVFEAFYKKDLARRLLLARSASFDAERLMLTKLKTECGAGFTHNLEGMFKDMDLSKESVISFKSSKYAVNNSKNIDLYVNVLSQSAWPTYPEVSVDVPEYLASYLESFRQFYVDKHNGRKLVWRHSLSHCVLKAHFPKGTKELVLSAFQGVVLLQFNDAGSNGILTYMDLKNATGLSDAEITRTLQSLALSKSRVLKKSPQGAEIKPTDKFQVNANFENPKFRVKINQIQLKETKKENRETHERVAQDRQYETQAAIIRIMKSRKSIRHVELVQQVIEQTKNRGMLDIGEIKKNIEKLIDKDYMDREGDGDVYVYVA